MNDGKNILVVDDKTPIRELLRLNLAGGGYSVETAVDGVEGLALATKKPFDLIVTDVWMPAMDGIEMMGRIRLVRPGQRCLLISGGRPNMPSHSSLILAESYGADDILHKPFSEDALLQKVKGILDR